MADWKPRQLNKPEGWVGIPKFHGAGSVIVAETKLRFVVMTRFASDLEKFFQSGSQPMPLATVLNIAVQVVNSLEYIHSKHYTHNDIKAQNLLLDSEGCDVFLVDFGLSCKYKDNFGFHCDGDGDERKAHEGTLEYTSRDAHIGAHSRRGDLETLGYNLVHWASGFLPWKETEDPEYVQAQKNGFLENVETFLVKCFKPAPYPAILKEYFDYICELEFRTKPDYKHIRKMLGQALDDLGSAPHTKLQFGKKTKIRKSRKSDAFPMIVEEDEGRATRSQDDGKKVFWQDILDPESIMKSASRSNFDDDSNGVDPQQEAAEKERQMAALANPTPEMWKLMEVKRKLEEERQKMGWKEQLAEYNKRNMANKLRFASMDLTPSYNTPVMEEVIAKRAARLARDHHTPDPSDDEMDDDVFNAVATRTRGKKVSECIPEPPSCLPTPAATAPSSPTPPTPSPQTPGQKYESCTICFKTMNSRSLNRHYTTVHSMKRPLSSTPSKHSGLTPKLKRGRVTPKSTPETDSQPPPLLRHQTPLVGQEQEILPRRRKAVIDMELNPADSPSKNIRMAPCPVCGVEIAKSLIPKHFQDSHSPSASRRTRKKVESVTGAMARVAVSTETPEKIRNFDSPARPNITKETVGNIVSTFRRATRSCHDNILYEL